VGILLDKPGTIEVKAAGALMWWEVSVINQVVQRLLGDPPSQFTGKIVLC
jgi:hypothetical protein